MSDTNIEEIFAEFLQESNKLCGLARFELMMCLFEQFDDIIDRDATVAGLQAYLNAEKKDIEEREWRRHAH